MHKNLREFISVLYKNNEIIEIDEEVDPYLEIAEIHRRVIAGRGPALLFKNVKDKKFPVVTNLFGTAKRVDLAFGDFPKQFLKTVAELPHTLMPPKLSKLWSLRSMGKTALKLGFKHRSSGPVTAVKKSSPDLTELPAITSWQLDGGPFITLPLVRTSVAGFDGYEDLPDNLGMYRIQIYNKGETGMHFQIGKGGGFHLSVAEKLSQNLPAHIYLGGPPALILGAIAPLPENVPELLLASLIAQQKHLSIKIPESPIELLGEAEFCLVGHCPPAVRRPEGPFGDHYGYYSLVHDYPVFRVDAMYHRQDAIYPATVVGKPTQEDAYIGNYLQELLQPLIRVAMPQIRDIWSYGESGFHALTAAVLQERYERESLSAAFRILGEGQLSLTKFLIGVDRPMNLRNFRDVLVYVLQRVRWDQDLVLVGGTAMDSLDYAGPVVNKGSKGVLLGIGEQRRSLPSEFKNHVTHPLVEEVGVFCPGCLVVQSKKFSTTPLAAKEIAQLPEFAEWQLIVVVDNAKQTLSSVARFIWTAFTRFEPAADMHAKSVSVKQNRLIYEGPVALDARMKPWYPDELFADDATKKLVDARWQKYFSGKNVVMGDGDGVSAT